MTDTLTAENLQSLPKIRHAFFTKDHGNAGLLREETRTDALAARAQMAAHLGVAPENLLTCHQTHSPDVVTVTKNWQPEDHPKADALVTNLPGFAIGILTADCVPVLFADERARVIGAAHAGWRGAISGVLENTLKEMQNLGANKKSIHAALGPCIWQLSYEVSAEFLAPFLAENPDNQKFFMPGRADHFRFDLPGYVINKLKTLGLASVEKSPADTCANPENFFSHRYSTLRNEQRKGNLLSAIALEKSE